MLGPEQDQKGLTTRVKMKQCPADTSKKAIHSSYNGVQMEWSPTPAYPNIQCRCDTFFMCLQHQISKEQDTVKTNSKTNHWTTPSENHPCSTFPTQRQLERREIDFVNMPSDVQLSAWAEEEKIHIGSVVPNAKEKIKVLQLL